MAHPFHTGLSLNWRPTTHAQSSKRPRRQLLSFSCCVALGLGAPDCCCPEASGTIPACPEGFCTSAHAGFEERCMALVAQDPCEVQFVCTWHDLPPCEHAADCGPKGGEERGACLAAYQQGFAEFRRLSAATLFVHQNDVPQKETWLSESRTDKEEALLSDHSFGALRRVVQQEGGPSHLQMLFSDASAKILNCWGIGGRYWHAKILDSQLGQRSSTVCAPDLCTEKDVMSEVVPIFFRSMSASNLDGLQQVDVMELSHWADIPLDFVIIGLDGCGSTSLRRNLAMHPDVNFTGLSVHNSDEDFFLMELGRQTLPSMSQVESFAEHREEIAGHLGLYQPAVWSEDVLRQILLYIPNIKLVVSVCDPVDRFERKLQLELSPTIDDLEKRMAELMTGGKYLYFGDVLRAWKKDFNENLLFVEKDSLSRRDTYDRVASFLGIRPFPSHARFQRHNSRGGRRTALCADRMLLEELKGLLESEYRAVEEFIGWDNMTERLRHRQTRCEKPDSHSEDSLKFQRPV